MLQVNKIMAWIPNDNERNDYWSIQTLRPATANWSIWSAKQPNLSADQ